MHSTSKDGLLVPKGYVGKPKPRAEPFKPVPKSELNKYGRVCPEPPPTKAMPVKKQETKKKKKKFTPIEPDEPPPKHLLDAARLANTEAKSPEVKEEIRAYIARNRPAKKKLKVITKI